MAKLYQYIILKEDGTREELKPQAKMSLQDIYKAIDCETIALVPKPYYPDDISKRATLFCDDNGLLEGKSMNSNLKTIRDLLFNDNTYIVGKVLVEQVYHNEERK